jgi:hypothetical protein
MTESLTPDRFRELADAYGGVIARWPDGYRISAERMAREPFAAAVLADALALDVALDRWQVPTPSRSLADKITAGRTGHAPGAIARRLRLWWSGIGLAAALAGATAGAATVALVAPVDAASGTGTSFGDVSGQES